MKNVKTLSLLLAVLLMITALSSLASCQNLNVTDMTTEPPTDTRTSDALTPPELPAAMITWEWVDGEYVYPVPHTAEGMLPIEEAAQKINSINDRYGAVTEITPKELWENSQTQLYVANNILFIIRDGVASRISGYMFSLAIADLDGDGYYEIYAGQSWGSGWANDSVYGYNIINPDVEITSLSARGYYDYYFYVENGVLCGYSTKNNGGPSFLDAERILDGPLMLTSAGSLAIDTKIPGIPAVAVRGLGQNAPSPYRDEYRTSEDDAYEKIFKFMHDGLSPNDFKAIFYITDITTSESWNHFGIELYLVGDDSVAILRYGTVLHVIRGFAFSPLYVALADLNNDGFYEVVVGGTAGSGISRPHTIAYDIKNQKEYTKETPSLGIIKDDKIIFPSSVSGGYLKIRDGSLSIQN